MSIVERALHQVDAKAKAEAGSPLETRDLGEGATEEPTITPSFADEASSDVVKPAPAPAQRLGADTAGDPSALTSRDLKAIVHVDLDLLRKAGRVPSESLASQTEDEIRRIKWPLLKAIQGDEGVAHARNNVVLVTSALPGEGKTFTSLNLALSIVRDREMRVVLVDGDVAKPGLTPSLGLEGRPGLNDALEDTSLDISQVTYQTDVEGLYFVPAGAWNAHAPEFFAGSRMPQLMDALSRRVGRGVVIFDSPPLLATNEAQVATRFAGQVLIVVRAEETEQRAVLDAIALVDKEAPVSAVLNRCMPTMLSRYYGQYYYGYRYGQAYGHRSGSGRTREEQARRGGT